MGIEESETAAEQEVIKKTGIACDVVRQQVKKCIKESECVQLKRLRARDCLDESDLSYEKQRHIEAETYQFNIQVLKTPNKSTMQQEKKTKPCPYKCMRCPDEGHPELDSEPEQEEVFRAKWEITSSEEEDFIAKPVPKEGPKKANDKKKFYQAQARREPDLDVDSIHFAHLGGFSSVDPMKGKRDNKPKILTRPKVPASKNNVDFSKPLDHWMKKETIKEVYGFIREHAKNKKGIPTDEDLD